MKCRRLLQLHSLKVPEKRPNQIAYLFDSIYIAAIRHWADDTGLYVLAPISPLAYGRIIDTRVIPVESRWRLLWPVQDNTEPGY